MTDFPEKQLRISIYQGKILLPFLSVLTVYNILITLETLVITGALPEIFLLGGGGGYPKMDNV